jgi:hypothetical protein
LVPIVFLIIVSFPPLFGHELIAVYASIRENLLIFSLTGFVWSMPVAFLLVAFGSIAGESLLFLSFRHFLHSRIVQFRKEHEDNYGTIVQVINQHKRWMIFLIRLSAIPVLASHLLRLKVGTFFNAIVFVDRRDRVSRMAVHGPRHLMEGIFTFEPETDD